MFDTYGPFVMKTHDKEGIDDLFVQIRTAESRLQNAIGIYVISAKSSKGVLLPWYVGRTWNEFGNRIVQHYKAKKFAWLIDEFGPITFFLLPRATPKGRVKSATEKVRLNGLKSIRELEFMLIGTCLKLNPELLNKQEATFFNSLHVAGYIDNGPSDRNFPAAKALSKLLKT